MRLRLTAPIAMALLGPLASPAPAASLSRLAADRPAADARDAAPAAEIARLLRGEASPVDCFSPVLLAASLDERWDGPEGGGPLAARPPLAGARSWISPAGPFRYHYAIRADSPGAVAAGSPEEVESIERLDRALLAAADLLIQIGLRPPEGDPLVDVYLVDPGSGVRGYTVPGAPVADSFEEDRRGFLVLSPHLADPFPVAAHQLAHLALLGYSAREAAWWHEATAAWVGFLAAGDAGHEAAALAAHMAHPEAGPGSDDLLELRGAFLLPVFLSLDESPPTSVARVWDELAALPGDNLPSALDAVARRGARGSLRDLMRAYYASWVADAAGRSRLIASLGTALPSPSPADEVTDYPVTGQPGDGVSPLGATFIHLLSLPRPGGLSLTLEGERSGIWDALLLVRGSPLAPFLAVPMEVDGGGTSRIRYPWERISDSLLLAINLAEGGGPAGLTFWARHRSIIPFDLLELAAEPFGDGILLRWSTDSETDLRGWNIYRSDRPDGRFERLNRVLLPAAGGDRVPAGYRYVDDTARGRKAYYRAEAVTVDGFTRQTPVTGTYLPRRP